MSRDLTAGAAAAVVAEVQRVVFFFEAEFEGGTVRLCTWFRDLDWNGQTWTGAGDLIGISGIEEDVEIVASSVTFTLSGANPALVSAAIANARANMPGRCWVGFLTEAETVIADPFLAFEGLMSEPVIELGPDAALISITYESDLVELQRPREWRFTPESHKVRHPGDLAFDFVPKIQDKELKWTRN